MHSENIKFIEKLEELIKVMINKEPTLKFMYLVQEIEKLYDLQFKKQNAKDEELKIKETEEQPTIELKAKNGKNKCPSSNYFTFMIMIMMSKIITLNWQL